MEKGKKMQKQDLSVDLTVGITALESISGLGLMPTQRRGCPPSLTHLGLCGWVRKGGLVGAAQAQ